MKNVKYYKYIIINRRKNLMRFEKFDKQRFKDYFHTYKKKKRIFFGRVMLQTCFFDYFQKWLCKKILLVQGT